jgi:hypothetical protein
MIPDLGIAAPHAPAVVQRGHHVFLVGLDHLIDLEVEVLEHLEVGAQCVARRVEPSDDPDIWPSLHISKSGWYSSRTASGRATYSS